MINLVKIVSLFLITIPNCYSQTWEWVRQISGAANDSGLAIDVDDQGNVFIAGRCKGGATFENEDDPIYVPGFFDGDIFVSKYDKYGNLIWGKVAGSSVSGYDLVEDIVVDNEGGCYVTGIFNDTSYFDTDTLFSSGGRDVFIAKLNAEGEFLWEKGFGGTANDHGFGITRDIDGNILFCGYVVGEVDFEGFEFGTAGDANAYIGHADLNGNVIDMTYFGSPYRSSAQKIEVDENGDVYICGAINGHCNYQGTTLLTENSPVWPDAFLLKCSSDLSLIWFQSGGGSYTDVALNLEVSNSSVYLTGSYSGTATFDTITRTFGSTAIGAGASNVARDLFIASYDKITGNIKWLVDGGNEGLDQASGVTVTSDEMIYFTGFFKDSITIVDTTIYSGGYNSNQMITGKLDSTGQLKWVRETGNDDDNRSYGLALDQFQNVYVSGDFYNPISFDGITRIPSNRDAFGGKLTQHPNPRFTFNNNEFCNGDTLVITLAGITSPLTFSYETEDAYTYWTDSTHIYYLCNETPEMYIFGTIYAENNSYIDSLILDSIITVLEVPENFLVSDTSKCSPFLYSVTDEYESYNWNDGLELSNEIYLSESGTYNLTITTENGCIAMDTMEVMVEDSVSLSLPSDTLACTEFIYSVSDAYVTYSWNEGFDEDNEILISITGIYTLSIYTEEGCAGFDTMNVEIINLIPSLPSDTTICEVITSITIATEEGYESYEWSNGDEDVFEIVVTESGEYSVVVTDENGCEGSNSTMVTFTDCSSIQENNALSQILTYSRGTNYLKNLSDLPLYDIMLYDTRGNAVLQINQLNGKSFYNLDGISTGVYFLYFRDSNCLEYKSKIVVIN